MKKFLFLALAAAAVCGTASAQEVQYVEDCSQGVIFNKAADNWFITLEGGANMLLRERNAAPFDAAPIKDRIAPQAGLYFGKWISPNFGFRFGANWTMPKGAVNKYGDYKKYCESDVANMNANKTDLPAFSYDNGKYYASKFMGIGPEFDVMISLTNWWCGYHPGRVFNAVLHGGAGAYWTFYRGPVENAKTGKWEDFGWHDKNNTILFANVGLQFNFRVAKHVELFIDPQFQINDFSYLNFTPSLNAGITFNLGKTEWGCPTVPICPTWKYTDAEGDALTQRLANAEARIKDLQKQLDDCLRQPKQTAAPVVKDCEGLVTIYYPINSSALSAREKNILKSVAQVMINSNKSYKLTGWADNYTGSADYNVALRNARVNGVKNFLVSCGVDENKLEATIDNNNLTDFGAASAPLDRAVTIDEK